MVRLEPQHERIPDDVLTRAKELGDRVLATQDYKREIAIAGGGGFYYCEAIRWDEHVRVKIIDLTGNFLTHPRTGKLRLQPYFDNEMNEYYLTGIDGGGWRKDLSELANIYTYPLQDGDKGTWVATVFGTEIEWTDDENYGNCYWIGEDGATLSWKGPPNGFPIGGIYQIPGLTQSLGDGLSNTCFGVHIYEDGAYLCHGPQWFADNELKTLVVGAMYIDGRLFCQAVTNKTPGIFLQLWTTQDTGTTWTLVQEVTSTWPRTTAQISKDGKKFVYDSVLYTIADDLKSFASTTTIPAVAAGTRVVVGRGGYGSPYTYAGQLNLWPGMDVSEGLKNSVLSVDAKFKYETAGSGGYQKSEQPVYRGNPATQVAVSQYGTFANSEIWFSATANGTYCTLDWSGVDRVENGFGVKRTTQCNSDFTVTATANPQGVSGLYVRTAQVLDMVVSGDQGQVNPVQTGNMPYRPVTASQYYVSNAIGDVTWYTTKGTITSNGYATFSGTDYALVYAVDSCGRESNRLEVAIGRGTWVLTQNEGGYTPSESCGGYYGGYYNYLASDAGTTKVVVQLCWGCVYGSCSPSGGIAVDLQYTFNINDYAGYYATCSSVPSCFGPSAAGFWNGYGGSCPYVKWTCAHKETYSWRPITP